MRVEKMKTKHYRLRFTKKNKGLEPIVGKQFIIGYDREIHGEDSVELTYTLPLGAIKRLIQSYFEEMEMVDRESVYLNQSGSHGLRMYSYASRMLKDLEKQMKKHGLPGKRIIKEVFNVYFKKEYDKMNKYQENHPSQSPYDFKRCEDPECCVPLTFWKKTYLVIQRLYPSQEWLWEFKWKIRNLINK